MIYPPEIENKIGFLQIRDLLRTRCLSDLGENNVSKMKFETKFDTIKRNLFETYEFIEIIKQGTSFPSNDYINVESFTKRVKVEGTFLTTEELFELQRSLNTIFKILNFFRNHSNEYPLLYSLSSGVPLQIDNLPKLENYLTSQGDLRNDASSNLMSIRRKIIKAQETSRSKLSSILTQAKKNSYISSDVSLTVRSGRMVIPIAAEHKRKIKGFIHDESATGQTVYLEPAEVLDLNNQVRELEYEEKREIVKILINITDQIRPNLPHLRVAYDFLGQIDFIRAKALLSVELQTGKPKLTPKPLLKWVDARHPLLFLAYKKSNRPVVPLSILLDEINYVLVISGPNAGGKSVCLKTVALLQYMLQCGVPIPVAENSEIGLFEDIFIDIGDEQSIENDLSTYSSHLSNMKQIVEHANEKSLYLIDEFGTGTDPIFGGAMAEALLHQLVATHSFGIVTTHYGNLKEFASRTDGVLNGAMRYHVDRMEPLYELSIGKPGSSFALEIASNIGIPSTVINRAKELLGSKQVNFEQLIIELEKEKEQLSQEYNDAIKKNELLEKSIRTFERNRYDLETQKRVIINKAKSEAKQLLDEANRRIENTIRSIKENKAEKPITKKVRSELKQFEIHLKPKKITEKKSLEHIPIAGKIVVGDFVKVKGQGTVGRVESLNTKEATLGIGSLRSIVKLNRLERISNKEAKASGASNKRPAGIDFNRMKAHFKPEIDLRGMRVDEVMTEVDTFIDQALLVGLSSLRIIHGRGSGVLREVVRRQLMTFKEVQSMEDEHEERGGSGVTCILLK